MFELLLEQPCAGHLGAEKTEKQFADHFYYPNVKPTIIGLVCKCRECAIHKPSRENTIAPMQHIKANRPLKILQLDFIGPFTKSHGFSICNILSDRLVHNNSRRGHIFKLSVLRLYSKPCRSFIVNRSVNVWNSLPELFLNCNTISVFKLHITRFLT